MTSIQMGHVWRPRSDPHPYRPSTARPTPREQQRPPRPQPDAGPPNRPDINIVPPRLRIQLGSLGFPHGELGRRAIEFGRQREAAQRIPLEHLPKWRLRFVIALGFLPVLWVLPRCRVSGCKHWPCAPLLKHLRAQHGWNGGVQDRVKALSTKRNRRRAAARNPTAVSHRARRRPDSGRARR
jgi:hypothetical protein